MRKLMLSLLTMLSMSSGVAHAAGTCPSIVHKKLELDGRNDEWTSAAVKVQGDDLVIVIASGKVKLGEFLGEAGPNGVGGQGLGKLEMKVGTGTVVTAGERFVGGGWPEGGSVKFRILDKPGKYSDNSGKYLVHVIVLPNGTVPAATAVQGD